MMLDWLGRRHDQPALFDAGRAIEGAVAEVLVAGKCLPVDQGGSASTREVGDAVASAVARFL
jgi:3-isopropylmalate dehydrogenase